jgi:hypothetical protein
MIRGLQHMHGSAAAAATIAVVVVSAPAMAGASDHIQHVVLLL